MSGLRCLVCRERVEKTCLAALIQILAVVIFAEAMCEFSLLPMSVESHRLQSVSSLLFPVTPNTSVTTTLFIPCQSLILSSLHPQTNMSFEAQEVSSPTQTQSQPQWRQKVM